MSEDIVMVSGVVFVCSLMVDQTLTIRREAVSLAHLNNGNF